MEIRRRVIAAAVALLLGIAFCFVMYWWQLRYQYATHGLGLNLFAALPFGGLAAMVIGRTRRVPAVLGWLVLAVLTCAAYVSAARSSNSTAALAWIVPFIYGAFILSVLFAVDHVLQRRKKAKARAALP